jgi:molybdate transport system substrate-binding protein
MVTDNDTRPLRILSPVAVKSLLEKIVSEAEQRQIGKVVIEWGESAPINANILKGVEFDIAVLTPNFLPALIKEQKIDPASETKIARSGLGLAVKEGARKPEIPTVDAFKAALLAAKSIGIVDGSASSRYLVDVFAKLEITDQLEPKLKRLHGPAYQFIPSGEPEMAITQIAAIVPFDGIELAAPLPESIQLYTTFVAVASTAKSERKARFLRALREPSYENLIRACGLEPIPT